VDRANATLPTTSAQWHLRVWRLTWPVILANITIPLVGVADVAVMGRLPDPAYIGAVAMGAAMFSAVYWLFGFLRMATTGLSAQAYGRYDLEAVVATFLRACFLAGVLGIAIVALQWPLERLLFTLFNASEQVTNLASTYYQIRILGAPALLIHLAQLGILFGLQRMRDTLWLSIGLNITNLSLDVLFVLGLGMGVEGVALGTIISEWGATILGFWLIHRALKQLEWQSNWREAIRNTSLIQGAAVRQMFHVSSNLVVRTFFVQLPFFAGTVLATGLGDVTLAVHGVLMQLFFVMTYSLDGFAHTAETLGGYCFGARKPNALKRAMRFCALWAMFLGIATGCLYYGLGDAIVAQFTISQDVRVAASAYIPWLALAPIICVWAFLFDGIFIGTTHIVEMRNSMFAAAIIWGGALYGMWQTPEWIPPYHAVWVAMLVFMIARGIFLALYYPRLVRAAA